MASVYATSSKREEWVDGTYRPDTTTGAMTDTERLKVVLNEIAKLYDAVAEGTRTRDMVPMMMAIRDLPGTLWKNADVMLVPGDASRAILTEKNPPVEISSFAGNTTRVRLSNPEEILEKFEFVEFLKWRRTMIEKHRMVGKQWP